MTATKISQQDQPLNHDASKDRQIIGNSVGISTDEEDEDNTYGMLGKTQILSINENSETNLEQEKSGLVVINSNNLESQNDDL